VNTNPAARKPHLLMTIRQRRRDLDRLVAVPMDLIAADAPDQVELIAQSGINRGRPVRTTVWRVAATDHSGLRDWGDASSSGLAAVLTDTDTGVGETVVDVGLRPCAALRLRPTRVAGAAR
jgi:hypothetical protein